MLHTGDFKMDQLPLDGRLTDLPGFARLGAEGVDLIMVDSTNAEVPGFVPTERDIAPVLDGVFRTAPRRIIVACFASHVHRVQQVLDAAATHGRKVALVGRSMVRNMGVARDLGYLQVPPRPDGRPQGDRGPAAGRGRADLHRVAGRADGRAVPDGQPRPRDPDRRPSDTVILASSLIPGNETDVFRVINGLTRLGAHVVHKSNALVHVSGHASAGELIYVYNLVKPRNVMPIHGEPRHLRANADLAMLTGVPPERVVMAEDGVVVDLIDGVARIAGAVPCGYVYVDGLSVGDVTEASLKDRRILGEEGFVSVFVVIDATTGKITGGPEVSARGSGIDDDALQAVLPRHRRRACRARPPTGRRTRTSCSRSCAGSVGRWVNETYRRRPMIVPVVVIV